MNSKTFARLMLLFPLFMFIAMVGYAIDDKAAPSQTSVLGMMDSFWNSFAIYWIIPYGFLVTYLLFWSHNKTREDIQATFSLAPIMLMFLAGGTYLLGALYMAAISDHTLQGREVGQFMIVALISMPTGLIGGYLVVGVSILLYKLFQKLRLIRD